MDGCSTLSMEVRRDPSVGLHDIHFDLCIPIPEDVLRDDREMATALKQQLCALLAPYLDGRAIAWYTWEIEDMVAHEEARREP
jgi:hypothetical protein